MQRDDLDRIMEVMHGAFDPEWCEAWTRRQVEDSLLIGNGHYLLIGSDGEIRPDPCHDDWQAAGFTLSRAGFGEEELLLFAVLPQYRGRGIGQRLLEFFASVAQGRGAERLLLEMRRGNSAESLYLRNGFAPVGLRRSYYRTLSGPRIDAITFSRTFD